MPDSTRLIKASMALRSVAPDMWGELVDAAREYSSQVNADMVRADPTMLLRAQGMAIAVNELATIFHQAPALYEKLMKSGKR
jgi:hypothetical protein